MIADMREGAVFLDFSIDQGGLSETSRPIIGPAFALPPNFPPTVLAHHRTRRHVADTRARDTGVRSLPAPDGPVHR